MKRKKPSFNESYHGYRTFSELLEDAQKEGMIEIETDKRSGTYVVKRFGSEMSAEPPPARMKPRRRRSSGRRRSPRPEGPAASTPDESVEFYEELESSRDPEAE
ncbi:MAG: OST-HTH/LOTUS domain-containing protein, partial [Gemmataceae bacterium]